MQSRYYDPTLGRFLNADGYASTGQGILGNNMFAYCNNNPVTFDDSTGHTLRPCTVAMSVSRMKPYITDQDDAIVGSKRFGLATVSHGGCGAVASYNALVAMGASITFDDVLAYYNSRMGLTVGFGFMGLLPYDIEQYFTSLGYTVVTTNQKNQIELLSKTADGCIMYYEYPHTYHVFNSIPIDAYGAHFVEYSRANDSYIGRNTSEGNGTYAFSSPYDYGTKGARYYAFGIFIFE